MMSTSRDKFVCIVTPTLDNFITWYNDLVGRRINMIMQGVFT